MAKKQLPKRIYVTKESDPNDKDSGYLVSNETLEMIDHGATVGIYELVETRTLKVTRDLK